MSSSALALALAVYVAGLILLRRIRTGLLAYLWGAFGLAALLVLSAQMGNWNAPVGAIQASALTFLANAVGFPLRIIDSANLVVPDPTGWSIMAIGIECSTVIEAAVFGGLMLFYPRFSPSERLLRLGVGLGATFLINLARLSVIIAMVAILGKPAVPMAHAVVGRLVFFVGIVFVYWRMMTMPTLRIVRRDLEVSGRAAL
jgi:exosortase family protein XrtG